MKNWHVAVLAGAVTAAVAGGVALAFDGPAGSDGAQRAATTMVAERGDDETALEEEGGVLRGLLQDPAFREDLWALRDRQQQAMRAWWDEYGDDPTGDEARHALAELRDAQRSALQDLMAEYGVERPDEGADGSALFDLMGDPEFRKDLWALQDETEAAAEAWWDEYGDDPTSKDARTALQKVHEEQHAALEELAEKYGVDLGGGALLRGGGPLGAGLLGGDLLRGPFGRGLGHDDREGPGGGLGIWDDESLPGAGPSSADEASVTL